MIELLATLCSSFIRRDRETLISGGQAMSSLKIKAQSQENNVISIFDVDIGLYILSNHL